MSLTKEQNEALKVIDTKNAIAGMMEKIRANKMIKHAPAYQQKIKKSEIHEIDFVKLPKEGGILTYFKGIKHPRQGFPVAEVVEKIDDAKKNIVAVLSGFKLMFSKNKIKTLIFLFLFRKQYEQGVFQLIISLWKQLRMYRLQDRYYCKPVRELLRVFESGQERIANKEKRNVAKLTGNIICMILEYDDAYRYRFQSIFGQLDKKALNKDTFKELAKIIELGSQSEQISPATKRRGGTKSRISETWKGAGLVLKVSKYTPIKKYITWFFKELNVEEIKLSVGDYYFAKEKLDFQWQKPSDYSHNSKIMGDEEKTPEVAPESEAAPEATEESKKEDE